MSYFLLMSFGKSFSTDWADNETFRLWLNVPDLLSICCSIFVDVRRASGGAATRLVLTPLAGVERAVFEGEARGTSSNMPQGPYLPFTQSRAHMLLLRHPGHVR